MDTHSILEKAEKEGLPPQIVENQLQRYSRKIPEVRNLIETCLRRSEEKGRSALFYILLNLLSVSADLPIKHRTTLHSLLKEATRGKNTRQQLKEISLTLYWAWLSFVMLEISRERRNLTWNTKSLALSKTKNSYSRKSATFLSKLLKSFKDNKILEEHSRREIEEVFEDLFFDFTLETELAGKLGKEERKKAKRSRMAETVGEYLKEKRRLKDKGELLDSIREVFNDLNSLEKQNSEGIFYYLRKEGKKVIRLLVASSQVKKKLYEELASSTTLINYSKAVRSYNIPNISRIKNALEYLIPKRKAEQLDKMMEQWDNQALREFKEEIEYVIEQIGEQQLERETKHVFQEISKSIESILSTDREKTLSDIQEGCLATFKRIKSEITSHKVPKEELPEFFGTLTGYIDELQADSKDIEERIKFLEETLLLLEGVGKVCDEYSQTKHFQKKVQKLQENLKVRSPDNLKEFSNLFRLYSDLPWLKDEKTASEATLLPYKRLLLFVIFRCKFLSVEKKESIYKKITHSIDTINSKFRGDEEIAHAMESLKKAGREIESGLKNFREIFMKVCELEEESLLSMKPSFLLFQDWLRHRKGKESAWTRLKSMVTGL